MHIVLHLFLKLHDYKTQTYMTHRVFKMIYLPTVYETESSTII